MDNAWFCFSILSVAFSQVVMSLPYQPKDIRSIALGGTGVASAKSRYAAEFNPALLSHYPKTQGLSISMFGLSARGQYDQGAYDAFMDVEDKEYIEQLKQSSDAMNRFDSRNFGRLVDTFSKNADLLSGRLKTISDKPIGASGGNLFSLSFPDKDIGVGFYQTTSVHLEASAHISNCDLQFLEKFTEYLQGIDINNPSVIEQGDSARISCDQRDMELDFFKVENGNRRFVNLAKDTAKDGKSYLLSNAEALGVVISELGLAFSHGRDISAVQLAFGVTPKYLLIYGAYAGPTIQSVNDGSFDFDKDLKDNYVNMDAFSVDIGFAAGFLKDKNLSLGLTLSNIIPVKVEMTSIIGGGSGLKKKAVKIEPQATFGASYRNWGVEVAMDIDLNANSPLNVGGEHQYLGFGFEYDLAQRGCLNLRTGTRINLKDSDDQILTAGLGVNIMAFYLDIGTEFADGHYGGGLQMGLSF